MAVRRLREMVIAGQFASGERISELAAVDRLGISRTPVRLALQTLAHEGLLEARSNGGFVVRDYSVSDMLDAIELRGVLEGMAARLAAERSSGAKATAKLRSLLEQIDELMSACGPDADALYEGYVELNAAFHDELLQLAQSPMLERNLAQVVSLPFASPNAFVKAGLGLENDRNVLVIAQSQHHALVEAIESGESARAERVGVEHAQTAASSLRRLSAHGALDDSVPGSNLLRENTG